MNIFAFGCIRGFKAPKVMGTGTVHTRCRSIYIIRLLLMLIVAFGFLGDTVNPSTNCCDCIRRWLKRIKLFKSAHSDLNVTKKLGQLTNDTKQRINSLIALNEIVELSRRIAWINSAIRFLVKHATNEKLRNEATNKCKEEMEGLTKQDKKHRNYLAKLYGSDVGKIDKLFDELNDLKAIQKLYKEVNAYKENEREAQGLLHIIEKLQNQNIHMRDIEEMLKDTHSLQDLKKLIKNNARLLVRIRLLKGLKDFEPRDLDKLGPIFKKMEGFEIICHILTKTENELRKSIATKLKR